MQSRKMGQQGEEGVTWPGKKGNGRATPSSPCSPISRPHIKTCSKTSLFRLLAKEGAVLQSNHKVVHTIFIDSYCVICKNYMYAQLGTNL